MTQSDSSTYRQYIQALEEENVQQTISNGALPNGFARGATPTASMLQNDTFALKSAYDEEEEERPTVEQSTLEPVNYNPEDQYKEYSQYDQIPEHKSSSIIAESSTGAYDRGPERSQQPIEATPIQIITTESRDYRKLWKWAYKEACKQCGITVSPKKFT